MKNLHNSGKRDENEGEILALLRARNIKVTQFRPGDGADLLIWINPLIVVEVKNPKQPPSKRQLTEDEKETEQYCEGIGLPYYVVEYVEEVNDIINRYFARMK